MNKNNLHTTMLLALRGDPRMYTVFRDVSTKKGYYSGVIINFEGETINLDDYTEDLLHKTNSELDIVRVYLKTDFNSSYTDPVQVNLVYDWAMPIEHMSFKDALLVDGTIKPKMECIPSGFESFQTPRSVLDKLASTSRPKVYKSLILADWFVYRR